MPETAVEIEPTCPLCGAAVHPGCACPRCSASPQWIDLAHAVEFAKDMFPQWQRRGAISAEQNQAIADYYISQRRLMAEAVAAGKEVPLGTQLRPATRCWSCTAEAPAGADCCALCGFPLDLPANSQVRYLSFLWFELEKLTTMGLITLSQAHACQSEARATA